MVRTSSSTCSSSSSRPGSTQPKAVHRRVVLDHREPQARVLDLLPEQRERPVGPGRLRRVAAPVRVPARKHADGLVDADLSELRPGRVEPGLQQDLGEAQHDQKRFTARKPPSATIVAPVT